MFSPVPVVGDAVYLGLSRPAPRCFVRLQMEANQQYDGIGVDPKRPPIAVEVWDGQQWVNAPIVNDETGGFNRPGAFDVFVPRHDRSNLSGITAAWVRIHVRETDGDQPPYTKSPEVFGVQASTIGGLTEAAHCELIEDDVIGTTSGTPGDRLQFSRTQPIGHLREKPALRKAAVASGPPR